MTTLEPVLTAAAWEAVLGRLPQPHPLQSWTWGQFKSRWGWSARSLRLGPETAPEQAALVLKRRLPRLPLNILYVPKGPVLDYDDPARRQQALAQLAQLARQERAIFVKIDPDVALSRGLEPERPCAIGQAFLDELRAAGWRFSADQVQFRNTVELDLTRPEDDLLAAMKQKTRYNIRYATRKGVTVRPGTPDDFPLLANMYRETAVRDQFAIRPVDYYLDAWRSFHQAGMGHALVAEFEGEPLAAIYLVYYGRRAIYMYGASTDRERQRMPNYLLQWEGIRWAKAQGCSVYDLWGAPDEFVDSDSLWGVWRFKAGFEGEVVRHVGAWDYVARPFWYWVYTAVIPRYLDYLRRSRDRSE